MQSNIMENPTAITAPANMGKRKRTTLIALSVIAVMATVMIIRLADNKKVINEKAQPPMEVNDAVPVRIVTVHQQSVNNSRTFSGTFEARKELPLNAEAQGTITRLNIREGDRVSQGQVIATIDATTIQANLRTAQIQYEKAVKDAERYERLAKAGAVSQKQYEDVAVNIATAKANVTAIQQQMKYTTVRSPMSGVISEVKVEQGSFAQPGSNIGKVVDVSRLKMVVQVSEGDVVRLRKGQPVSISTDIYPGKTLAGKISLIAVQADEARKYNVEVELSNNDQYPLKAGMFGTVAMDVQEPGSEGQKLFIPRRAIVGSVKDPKVYVLNPDTTVSLKAIQIQDRSGDEVIVLSGLGHGDKVVTTGQINLKTGKKVVVIQ